MSLPLLGLLSLCLCFPGSQEVQLPGNQLEPAAELQHQECEFDQLEVDFRLDAHRGFWADSALPEPMRRSLNGQWQLAWDDHVDSELDHEDKTSTIKFTDVDGVVSGQFVGLVAGTERDAIISGGFEGEGSTRIFVFQQREAGYVCSYQAIDNGGEITGVWHDTRNRSGDFRLLKYQ